VVSSLKGPLVISVIVGFLVAGCSTQAGSQMARPATPSSSGSASSASSESGSAEPSVPTARSSSGSASSASSESGSAEPSVPTAATGPAPTGAAAVIQGTATDFCTAVAELGVRISASRTSGDAVGAIYESVGDWRRFAPESLTHQVKTVGDRLIGIAQRLAVGMYSSTLAMATEMQAVLASPDGRAIGQYSDAHCSPASTSPGTAASPAPSTTAAPMMTYTESAAGSTAHVKVGQPFAVALGENSKATDHWLMQTSYGITVVGTSLDASKVPPPPTARRANGTRTWVLVASKPGRFKVEALCFGKGQYGGVLVDFVMKVVAS